MKFEAVISVRQHQAIMDLLDERFHVTVEPWPGTSVIVRCETEGDFDTFRDLMRMLAVERPELFRI